MLIPQIRQPQEPQVQFWLGVLHLYAMSLAGAALAVHAAAALHHFQRVGERTAGDEADEIVRQYQRRKA